MGKNTNRRSADNDSRNSLKSTRTVKHKVKKLLDNKDDSSYSPKVKKGIEKSQSRPTRNVAQKRIEPVKQAPCVITIDKSKLTNQGPKIAKPFKEDSRPAVKETKSCIKEAARRIDKVWYSTTRKDIVARVIDKSG